MNDKPMTAKEVASHLADFIVNNWHHCPVSEDVPIQDCDGWGCDNCKRCIRKHAHQLG